MLVRCNNDFISWCLPRSIRSLKPKVAQDRQWRKRCSVVKRRSRYKLSLLQLLSMKKLSCCESTAQLNAPYWLCLRHIGHFLRTPWIMDRIMSQLFIFTLGASYVPLTRYADDSTIVKSALTYHLRLLLMTFVNTVSKFWKFPQLTNKIREKP